MTESPARHGDRVVLERVAREHVAELRRILATPQVRNGWRDEDASPQWPFYERDADGDGWHDGMLMDLLAEDLEPPAEDRPQQAQR